MLRTYIQLHILISLIFLATPALADSIVSSDVDFGQVYQTSSTTNIGFDKKTGAVSSISGGQIRNNSIVADVTYTNTNSSTKKVYIGWIQSNNTATSLTGGSGCTISVTGSWVLGNNYYNIPANSSHVYNVDRYTVKISGTCSAGTYTGTAQVKFGSSSGGSQYGTHNITLKLEIVTDLSQIEISNTKDLNFGTMLSTTAHNVVIDYNDNRTGNSSYLINDTTNPYQSGEFSISNGGASAQVVQIALPSSAVVINGANSMTVNNFTSNPQASTNVSIPANSNITVKVGATLNVTTGMPSGQYTGTYTITVNY